MKMDIKQCVLTSVKFSTITSTTLHPIYFLPQPILETSPFNIIINVFLTTVGEDEEGPASRESSPRLESPAPGLTPSTVMTRKHFLTLLSCTYL